MKVEHIHFTEYPISYAHPHSHNLWEILLYLEGIGTLAVGGNDYAFRPGMIVCQPPNITHSERSKEGFKNVFVRVENFKPISGNEPVVLFDDADRSIYTLLKLANTKFIKKEPHYREAVDALFGAVYRIILCQKSANSCQNPAIEKLKSIIAANISNTSFDLRKEIHAIGYSSEYFSKIFKKSVGYSPIEYLKNMRMEYSKDLIAHNSIYNFTIKEIAYQSGYHDSFYFLKTFKRHYGMTPSQYMICANALQNEHKEGGRSSF